MELLSAVPIVGEPLAIIIPFILVLGVVVFVHEYGHYIVGRWCGIRAEVFSIGFGPRLWGWKDKRGTEWQVAALPLGGYVRFVGDMDPASAGRIEDAHLTQAERKAAFHNAALGARAATVAAGPVFNFLLSIALFTALALAVGRQSEQPVIGGIGEDAPANIELQAGDRVLEVAGEPVESFGAILSAIQRADGEAVPVLIERDGAEQTVSVAHRIAAVIERVTPGMPASRTGLLAGDTIVEINGEPVASFRAIQIATADLPLEEAIEIKVLRDGVAEVFSVMPVSVERAHPVTGETKPLPTIGISAYDLGGIEPTMEGVGIGTALNAGVSNTVGIITTTVTYIGDLLFAGADPSQLGGPIRIAQVSGEQAERGFLEFVHLIAFLSTSIGLINLVPIPVLDGGHLMFYLVEALRGRPVGAAAMRYGTALGLSLVLLLMVFATYNDILRL
ncbi:MAG: RIP metalloprotease RseP [Pseudomonadota bacterium]